MSSHGRDRSVSGEIEESELGSAHENEGSQEPSSSKPGRKKNPNSQAARRDQNRIAQREFRLRKQQRIRDLEARVEILSGGKDEALGEMRKILKDLMAENQTLRNLLRSLGGFIGDGAGGLLPKLGWNLQDFEHFINKSETDTAFEGYQARKQAAATTGSSGSGSSARKRTSEDDAGAGNAKRSRGPGDRDDGSFPAIMPMDPVTSGSGLYPPSTRSPHESSLFTDLMRGSNGSPLFTHSSSSTYGGTPQLPPPPGVFPPPYMGSVGLNVDGPMGMPYSTSGAQQSSQRLSPPIPTPVEDVRDLDPKHEEAQKLISYHLDNYKRNSGYHLPASLRPTLVQRTVPHESVIDRIVHPDLRDRLILLRGRFSLVDCIHDYGLAVTIHGDDVLAHANWEINESWLKKYGFLLEQNTLNICNRWRRDRGLQELTLRDIAPNESQASM